MGLIDHIGELVGEPSQTKTESENDLLAIPQPSDLAQVWIKGGLVERQWDLIDGFVKAIKRVLENPEVVDLHSTCLVKLYGLS